MQQIGIGGKPLGGYEADPLRIVGHGLQGGVHPGRVAQIRCFFSQGQKIPQAAQNKGRLRQAGLPPEGRDQRPQPRLRQGVIFRRAFRLSLVPQNARDGGGAVSQPGLIQRVVE